MQILLAEDNPTNEDVARMLLQRLGHSCSVAHNGLEVLQTLRGGAQFDCILMDIQMPVMDGIEAARRIREEFPEASARPPIIAVTANAFESDRVACFAVGMIGFLTKPLRLEALREALEGFGSGGVPENGGEAERGDVDFEQFESIIDGGDEEAIEIFDDFCKALPEQIAELEEYCNAGDAGAFESVAHQLKGSCATFGLVALSERMGDLETLGRSGTLAELAEGWAKAALEAFQGAEELLRLRL